MIQQLIWMVNAAPPEHVDRFVQLSAAVGVVAALLWLMGARYSRQILALVGVTVGALVGKHLPEFIPHMNMSGPVLAIVGAIVLGIVAFISHRLLVGTMLGAVLAGWACLGTWISQHGQQSWSQPALDADMSLASFARIGSDLWRVLPPDVARVLPWAAGIAMSCGVALAIVWPRLATALNWSLSGATVLLVFGLAAMCYTRPQWVAALPPQTTTQAALFAGAVAFGAIVQLTVASRRPGKMPNAEVSV